MAKDGRKYHRIAEVRQLQGMAQRSVYRATGIPLPEIRRQEDPETDLRLSELAVWSQLLGVPLYELLVEPDEVFSPPVLLNTRLIKAMKTVRNIQEKATDPVLSQMLQVLADQLIELSPGLQNATPWRRCDRQIPEMVANSTPITMPDALFDAEGSSDSDE